MCKKKESYSFFYACVCVFLVAALLGYRLDHVIQLRADCVFDDICESCSKVSIFLFFLVGQTAVVVGISTFSTHWFDISDFSHTQTYTNSHERMFSNSCFVMDTRVRTCICMYLYSYIHICEYIFIYFMCSCTFRQICLYIHMFIYKRTYIHIYINISWWH